MKKLEIMNTVTRTFNKVGFQLKKHSPEILVVAGVVGTVTSAVLACRATTKVLPVIDQTKKDLGTLKNAIEHPETLPENVTVEDCKNDIKIVCAHAGVDIVKAYALPVALGAISITGILVGHNILHKRNLALAAAYATVDSGFKEYRNRVIERFGKELDQELKYNIREKEVEETVVNEDGTESTVKKTVPVAGVNRGSQYAIFFDETCKGWTRNAEANKFFLMQAQQWANEKLQSRGYLFLNDVYEMLGAQKTEAGFTVGWLYDENNDHYDNCVDFLIFDVYDEQKRLFVNGYEKSVLVDFNVDGNILNKMDINKINARDF